MRKSGIVWKEAVCKFYYPLIIVTHEPLSFTLLQPTVVTRAEPHNLRIVHPYEDRVLTIRENARSQVWPVALKLVNLLTRS